MARPLIFMVGGEACGGLHGLVEGSDQWIILGIEMLPAKRLPDGDDGQDRVR
jgi:hypothetical protein